MSGSSIFSTKQGLTIRKNGKSLKWISEPNWKAMLEKWENDATFKKYSEQNKKIETRIAVDLAYHCILEAQSQFPSIKGNM